MTKIRGVDGQQGSRLWGYFATAVARRDGRRGAEEKSSLRDFSVLWRRIG